MEIGGFDKIISLGYNCEVSFRIEDYTGKPVDSYPFTWAYVLDQNCFYEALLSAMQGTLLTGKYVVNQSGMFVFDSCKCSFHSKAEHKEKLLFADGTTNYEYAEQQLSEMRCRFEYLQHKFVELIHGEESTLFVMKVQNKPVEQMINNIESVKSFIKDYRPQNTFLLALVEKRNWDDRFDALSDERAAVDVLSSFAPDDNTKDGGAINEWMQVLDYYNHAFDKLLPNRIRRKERREFSIPRDSSYKELKEWTDRLFEAKQWLEQQFLSYRDQSEKKDKIIEELRGELEELKIEKAERL